MGDSNEYLSPQYTPASDILVPLPVGSCHSHAPCHPPNVTVTVSLDVLERLRTDAKQQGASVALVTHKDTSAMQHDRPNISKPSAVAYIRCSTERQDLSPDAQRDAIDVWAKRNNVRVVEHFEDIGISGGTELDKRPGLLLALDAIKEHKASHLVVAKRDRLARDVLTAALVERLCERSGASIVSADGTGNGSGPEAQLMRGIVDLFAQYERAIIRTRTKAALAVKKARGERVGGIPYGWQLNENGTLLRDESESEAIAHAKQLKADGHSLRSIAKALADAGHMPRTGKKWHVQVVKRMIERKTTHQA